MQLGANFVVTPLLREDVALVCNRKKVMFSPGCGTLTEIARAEELGCEVVKLFPGGTYGPGFVKAIKGPCPWTNIMPTGGVSPDEDNLRSWFHAGVTCVGMGSKMITKQFLADQDFAGLQELVAATLETIRQVRSE
jgi:2-dehydro-3-deoxyphosphogluconate aldolase/(4S)-4-hydroxy-2-oxoglutarate aldolase